MSDAELSRKIGVSPSSLSRFKHDKAGLSVANIDRLAAVFNLVLIRYETYRTWETIYLRYSMGDLADVQGPHRPGFLHVLRKEGAAK
jgi:transcriptional regulator with XRE-family HTH domain